jgi:glutaredoxin
LLRFDGVNAQVLGISVDSIPCLKAWADSLGKISYPLLSDFYPHGQVAQTYGVLRPDGTSERAIFIIDKNCTICYVDVHDIDDLPDNEVLFRELARVEGVPVPPPVSATEKDSPKPVEKSETGPAPQVLPSGEQPKVVMYCTAWCPACRRARAYLKMHKIEFEEIDITSDRVAAARVREWANGNETTPTFDIGGTILVNFNITRLNELLGIKE